MKYTRYQKPEYKGSRPPPSKRPRTSGVSIFFIMALVIAAAFISSGGGTPVDPNGPDGPPRLEPYYNASDYGEQKIVLPTDPQGEADNNLQLKTFLVEGCGEKTAMYFVIDTSGSMKFDNKLQKEQQALRDLLNVKRIGGKAVVGLATFSKGAKEEVPLSYIKDVEDDIDKAISSMNADGWTSTRDAMELAKDRLQKSIEAEEFPGYKYAVVLMTDGVPEIPDQPRTCIVTAPDPNLASGQRCFAEEQDPRVPVNIAEEITRLGVEIYAVNIYSPNNPPSDAAMYPYLKELLQGMATPPLDDHYFESLEGNNLDKVLGKICSPVEQYN